jgi:hypothetical protein
MQNDGINEHGVWAGEVIMLVLFYFKDDVHNKRCLCFFWDGPLPKLCPAVTLSHQDSHHSAVVLLLFRLWGPSWSKGQTTRHIFGREPSNDYFIKI